jgi:hypothetical protein
MIKKKYSPDFIGIGAMRCGTTWIADKLRKHPEIYIPEDFKELHFFDQFYNKGIEWYESNFSKKEEDQIVGEFTPKYLRSPKIAKLIKKHYPDTKLIISLRNPISRAFSHYNFLKKHTNIESNLYKSLFDKKYEILMAGLYGEQIQTYLKLFPLNNIHIIFFEDIINNPKDVVKKLYAFLEIDPHFRPMELSKSLNKRSSVRFKNFHIKKKYFRQFIRQYIVLRKILRYSGILFIMKILNKLNSKNNSKETIDKKSVDYLKNYYKNDLLILEKIVDREVSHWLE